jgi:hypothetical protein
MAFQVTRDVSVERDASGLVIGLQHLTKPFTTGSNLDGQSLASTYLRDVAGIYSIPAGWTAALDSKPSTGIEAGSSTELRFSSRNAVTGTVTVALSAAFFVRSFNARATTNHLPTARRFQMGTLKSPYSLGLIAQAKLRPDLIRRSCVCACSSTPAPGRLFLLFLLLLPLTVKAFADGPRFDNRWVATWQGSPTPGGTFFSPGCPSDIGLSNQTVRNIVHVSAGGDWVRARISNNGGLLPLNVGSASIGFASGGTTAVAGSIQPLRFGGQSSITIAAGGEALSDPVPMTVKSLDTLSISVYLPGSTVSRRSITTRIRTTTSRPATRLPPRPQAHSLRQSHAGCSCPEWT